MPHRDTPENADSDFQTHLHMQKLQSLGQLAGGVAHDFNNILSIIEGYARMIDKHLAHEHQKEHPHTDHPLHDKLAHILQATKRGGNLTRRLLAFGRQNIMHESRCDLAAIIAENEVLLRPLLTSRIALHLPEQTHGVFVPCDSDTISQILINLAVNARDAIPENDHGTITLTLQSDTHGATLRFSDTGSGIPDAILSKIFDPFFTTKEQGKGTGLGLSMVLGAMHQIHGSVEVASQPGQGTCFTLRFPPAEPAQPQADASYACIQSCLHDKTVLVVDDEEAILPILESHLHDLGMKVLKAANADTALTIQQDYADKIDFLLTDVVMPGLNGVRLSELLTTHRPETQTVFMTGYPNRASNHADAIDHLSPLPKDALVLSKPFNPEDLSPTLLKALERVNPSTH